MMYMNQYQTQAKKTAVFPDHVKLPYLSLGLMNEAGEAGGNVKKYLRGDYNDTVLKSKLRGELGDVLWYLTMLADAVGVTLEDVAAENLRKLYDRKNRGVLQGDGDTR